MDREATHLNLGIVEVVVLRDLQSVTGFAPAACGEGRLVRLDGGGRDEDAKAAESSWACARESALHGVSGEVPRRSPNCPVCKTKKSHDDFFMAVVWGAP